MTYDLRASVPKYLYSIVLLLEHFSLSARLLRYDGLHWRLSYMVRKNPLETDIGSQFLTFVAGKSELVTVSGKACT